MDIMVFTLMAVITLLLGILGLILKKEVRLLFAFIGGILGLLSFTSLNTDGSITLAYAYTSSFQTQTVGIWPLGYVLILFTVIDFGIGIILAAEGKSF